eukprot:2744993-Prymnesium_polylepis.1
MAPQEASRASDATHHREGDCHGCRGRTSTARSAMDAECVRCFIVTAWMVINLIAGSRKGESTQLPGDVDHNDWFTRALVSYRIGNKTIADPTEEQLRSMTEGDIARLAPKGAKCDQYGTCYGTEPIIIPFHDTATNAAKWLRDIELRWPCHGEARSALPPSATNTASLSQMVVSLRSSWRCSQHFSEPSARPFSRHTRGGYGWRRHCA